MVRMSLSLSRINPCNSSIHSFIKSIVTLFVGADDGTHVGRNININNTQIVIDNRSNSNSSSSSSSNKSNIGIDGVLLWSSVEQTDSGKKDELSCAHQFIQGI